MLLVEERRQWDELAAYYRGVARSKHLGLPSYRYDGQHATFDMYVEEPAKASISNNRNLLKHII